MTTASTAQPREHCKSASEAGATAGASKQRTEADEYASHQERLDLKREGKPKVIRQNTPEAGPGSRDADTLDRERHPRMDPCLEPVGRARRSLYHGNPPPAR